jgi:regulator of protease activity HflC (stomatin/prohibitin superfamily)
VTRVQPERVQHVEIGFRTLPGSKARLGVRAWSSPHGTDGIRRVDDEAVMITGDGNLLELQGTVRYTITNPRVYLFEVGDPAGILRDAAESVLREVVAGHTFADLLTTDRGRFQEQALERLRERCRTYGPDGLGLHVEGVALHDMHPPQDLVAAYHGVTQAMERRDTAIKRAEADTLAAVRKQEGENFLTERQAQADRTRVIETARARQAAFLARHRARTRLSVTQEWRLLDGAMQAVTAGKAPVEAAREYLKRRADMLAVQAALTDFRLYWDALAEALAGREKVLLDADRVPGRRHLWMVPAEPPRFVFPPSDRSRMEIPPPRGEREEP